MHEGARPTSRGGRDSRTSHDYDTTGLAGLDVVGNGGEATLPQSHGRDVIADDGVFLAHAGPAVGGLWFLQLLRLSRLPPAPSGLDAEVSVDVAAVVKTVVQAV